jgi:hypothetical protein
LTSAAGIAPRAAEPDFLGFEENDAYVACEIERGS